MYKPIILLLLLVGHLGFAQSAKITITALLEGDSAVKISLPLNGTDFAANQTGGALDQNGRFETQASIDKPGLARVTVNRKSFKFFIEPHEEYHLTVDAANKDKPFLFVGANAEGQYLYNKVQRQNYHARAESYMAKSPSIDTIMQLARQDAASEQKQYDELLAQKKINKRFHQFVTNDIDHYYASVLASAIYYKSYNDGDEEFAKAGPVLFKRYPLSNASALAAPSFFDYADQYASWYMGSYMRKKAGIVRKYDIRLTNDYLPAMYKDYADNLPEPAREYMLARFLHQYMSRKKYEIELVELAESFKNHYPKSPYFAFLKPEITEIRAFHEKVKREQVKGVLFLDDYDKISSLSELATLFKGKTVYVDMWATWCKPCIEQFSYHEPLKKFLDANKVEMLYLSIDKPGSEKRWKEMITFHKLTGKHLLASASLMEEMKLSVWGNKDTIIPRYLIIKDGKVVETNALEPGAKDKLYQQISQYL